MMDHSNNENAFSLHHKTTTMATVVSAAFASSSTSALHHLHTTEIWFKEDERWELTWPIWHMLPRQEKKELALKYGFDRMSDFEEWMSLQQTMKNSSASSTMDEHEQQYKSTTRYDNKYAYAPDSTPNRKKEESGTDEDQEAEEDDEDDDDLTDDKIRGKESSNNTSSQSVTEDVAAVCGVDNKKLPLAQLVMLGGTILLLPNEMLHRVFDYLPVETYATLALVSPYWQSFTRTEAIYKHLCERLYLHQCIHRQKLHVHRFNNSYRTMLEKRPHVRAGGGVYVMKYSRVKTIQRDMWTEIPAGAVLETTYYRYLYFQEDGRVIYALTTSPPHDMFRRLHKVCLAQHQHQNHQQQEIDSAAVWGTYQVHKAQVTVQAQQPWQFVQLILLIQPTYTIHGRNGYMSFDEHATSPTGCFDTWSPDRIVYEVPEEPFIFVKDKRL